VCINIESSAPYLTTPPLFAVEIRSESQSRESQRRKVQAYIRHGVRMAVLVLPGEGLEVFQPGREAQILSADDTFDGGEVLPGFRLPVRNII
jgi:Uma2 family endonuclease